MSDSSSGSSGAGLALIAIPAAAIAGIIALIVAIVVAIDPDSVPGGSSACGISGAAVQVTGDMPASVGQYSGDQLTNAAAILTIGSQRGVPALAQEVTLIAAMTESSLHNDTGGDRDSAGLFQMRPSQGWGTYAQVTDISFAINEFYDRLTQLPNWQTMEPGAAAQAIERSAFPDRYATHEAQAAQIMNALSGVKAVAVSDTTSGLTCGSGGSNTTVAGEQAPTGPHAAQIQQVIDFAKQQLGKNYVLGGAGPDVWDCSGLTMKAYATIGIDIDDVHSSSVQYHNGIARGQMHPLSEVQPGDLIFWGGANPDHVAISLGGNMILAATKPGDVVKIEKLWGTPDTQVWRPVDGLSTSDTTTNAAGK